jgi:hypothetical protein
LRAHCLHLLQDPKQRQWGILALIMDDPAGIISAGAQLHEMDRPAF